jgi:hypothetical protein
LHGRSKSKKIKNKNKNEGIQPRRQKKRSGQKGEAAKERRKEK